MPDDTAAGDEVSWAVPTPLADYAKVLGPESDDVLREMHEQAEREEFPHVGPAVGGWLGMCVRFADADRVFEFGSGFGYSAYWFARELPTDGEIVLTEIDADELEQAREYLDRGGLADRARFEHGDALEIIDEYEGPFDVVLIDCEKVRYAEAFEAVEAKVAPGGLVLADNAVAGGTIEAADLLAHFTARSSGNGGGSDGNSDAEQPHPDLAEMNEMTGGIAAYLEAVRAAPGFETVLLPFGEGVAVSQRRWDADG